MSPDRLVVVALAFLLAVVAGCATRSRSSASTATADIARLRFDPLSAVG